MKTHTIALFAAAVSLVLFVPEISLAQTSPTTQTNSASSNARAESADMVRAQAALDRTIDAKQVKAGDQFSAKLANKVHLKNGTELPAGTELVGKIGTDDMQQNGMSKLALCLDQAKLKDGKTIPVKATIVGLYGPGAGPSETYPVAPGDQVDNDWKHSETGVDQPGALSGIDLHSKLASRNSAVLVSTKKDDFKLKRGTEFALALAPQGSAEQSSNTH